MLLLHQHLMLRGRKCQVRDVNTSTKAVDIEDLETGEVDTFSRRQVIDLTAKGLIKPIRKGTPNK